MIENPTQESSVLSAPTNRKLAQSDPLIVSGARWFWWIAGLSLVNTILINSDSNTSFVIGLGFTLVADAMFREMQFVAFAIDAVAIGTIFILGWFAGRGHVWAFITGIILYAVDAFIYVRFEDWMPVGFHMFALVFIVRGMLLLRQAIKATRLPPVIATEAESAPLAGNK